MHNVMFQLIIFYYLTLIVFSDYVPWDTYFDHNAFADVDEKYKIYWTIHDETAEIGLEVESLGWIGWGISSNGLMINADVIVAWIENDQQQTPKLYNYYTTNERYQGPQLMSDQSNVQLLDGWRNQTKLYFRFTRNINPCSDHTLSIPKGTAKVIYAWNDVEPINDIPSIHLKEHSGNKAINLLLGETAEVPLPEEYDSFIISLTNYEVPTDDTTYYCQLLAFPEKMDINYMIRIDPVITPGNEGIVHHITLTSCQQQYVNPEDIGMAERCDDFANMPTNASGCMASGAIFAAWAVGGSNFYFPEHVGYEFGGSSPDSLKYAVIQVHYDNPLEEEGKNDSSGFRIYYTPQRRDYSAEMLTLGANINSRGVFVPAGVPGVVANGFCTAECTTSGLPEGGVYAFANLLHLHVLGTALKLRHIRNGIELPVLDRNDNYDFDYQQLWILQEEMHILPGDDLYLECVYNATDRDYMTWGGESTRHEMCLSFLYIYPKSSLTQCITQFTNENYYDFWNISWQNGWVTGDTQDINTWHYDASTEEALEHYVNIWESDERLLFCSHDPQEFTIKIPKDFEEYPDEEYCVGEAEKTDGFQWKSWYGYTIIAVLVVVIIAIVCGILKLGFSRLKDKNKNGYQKHEENTVSLEPVEDVTTYGTNQ